MSTPIRFVFLLLATTVSSVSCGEELLQKHFAAVGGKLALKEAKTIQRSGKIAGTGPFGAMEGTFQESVDLENLIGHDVLRLKISGYDYSKRTGWTNSETWTSDSENGVNEVTGQAAVVMPYQYAPSPLAALVMAKPELHFQTAGETDFNSQPCDVVMIDGHDHKFFLNKQTHLLEGLTVTGLMTMSFSDYAKVDDIQLPGKRSIEIDPVKMQLDYTFDETEMNQQFDASLTKMPTAHTLPAMKESERPQASDSPSGMITAEMLIGYLDKDDDAKLNLEEYILSHAGDPAGEVLRNFKSFDKNGDQFIDKAEAEPMVKFANAKMKSYAKPAESTSGEVTAEQLIAMMDKNGDQKIDKDEAVEDVRVAFGDIDLNHDGLIDTSEAQVMADYANRQANGKSSPMPKNSTPNESKPGQVTAQQIMQYSDTNGDGKIGKDEANDELKPHFQYLDTNGDGVLDLQEAETVAKYANEKAE